MGGYTNLQATKNRQVGGLMFWPVPSEGMMGRE